MALEEYVRSRKIEALLAMPGTIEIEDVSFQMEQAELEELSGETDELHRKTR